MMMEEEIITPRRRESLSGVMQGSCSQSLTANFADQRVAASAANNGELWAEADSDLLSESESPERGLKQVKAPKGLGICSGSLRESNIGDELVSDCPVRDK